MAYAVRASYPKVLTALRITALTANDPTVQDDSLEEAAVDIDAYLNGGTSRFLTPLVAPYPPIVVSLNLRHGAWKLASRLGLVNEALRLDHDEVLRMLEGIASGLIGPGVDPPPTSASTAATGYMTSSPRKLSRSTMGGL